MIAVENQETQMDELLDRMAEDIQLDKSRRERMKSSYESVKKWIEEDTVYFKKKVSDVYPHGSVRILTTVKPFREDEFDLDIVVQMLSNVFDSAQKVFSELKRCIQAYAEKHKIKFEIKNRCVRLNYAGDFHMDILLGVQETIHDANRIKIPDRSLGDWVLSNPRGYADWFLAKANSIKQSLLQKSLRAEKLPVDDFEKKMPLQRAVQLIKRYRDIYFQEDDNYETSSIILTTIAGQFYNGEESIFNTVDNIITNVQLKISNSEARLKILNPVNAAEDFTDKWDEDPKYYEAFKNFTNHLGREWNKLKRQHDVIDEGIILKGLFGEQLFNKSQFNIVDRVEALRESGLLGVSKKTGTLASTSSENTSTIKRNTFYGDGK